MTEIEKMKQYIERTKVKDDHDVYVMRAREVMTLLSCNDPADAIGLAFDYGKAKGYRAAKAEVRI